MTAFRFSEIIAAPREEVFNVIANPTKAREYLDAIVDSVKISDGPIGVGSIFRETRTVNEKTLTADLVITSMVEPSEVSVTSEAEGVTATYRYELEPDPAGTRVTWTCELGATGLRRMFLPIMAALMKREDGDHLVRIKSYIEGTATHGGRAGS